MPLAFVGSPMQILVIVLIILLLFGASRLGDVGKGLGEGIRNFKKSIGGDDDKPSGGADKDKDAKRLEEGAADEGAKKSSDATTQPAPAKESSEKSDTSAEAETAKDDKKA